MDRVYKNYKKYSADDSHVKSCVLSLQIIVTLLFLSKQISV